MTRAHAVAGATPTVLTADIRRITHACLEDVDLLVDTFVERLAGIPEYRTGVVSEDQLRRDARASISLLLHLIAGSQPADDALTVSVAVGRDRARRGIPLDALVHAIQLNFEVVWQAILLRARPAETMELIPASLKVWEVVTQHLSDAIEAYQDAVRDMARESQDQRRAAFASLLSEPEDPRTTEMVASALSFDASERFGVVVAAPGHQVAVRHAVSTLTQRRLKTYHEYSATGDVIVVQLSRRYLHVPSSWFQGIPCGVGPIADGLGSVPEALQLARRLVRINRSAAPLALRDAWLELVCDSAKGLLPRLSEDVLSPLATLAPHERDRILETLSHFLEGDGSVSRTADALYCHRNTIVNRLRRFTELTGRDVRRPSDAAVTLIAVRASSDAAQPRIRRGGAPV